MSRIAYPSIPREKDRRKDVNAITQTVEVLTGAKGDGLDRALTPRDMAEGGFANISYRTIGGRTLVDLTPVSSAATADKPTVPSGFSANAAFTNVILSWDRALFKGYAYTEIWRAASDDFGLASRVATSIPNVASDPIAMGSSYYYWIRFVNILGEIGPLHDTAGEFAQSAPDVPVLQQALTDAIRETELSTTLNARIDQIDTPTTGILDRLDAEIADRISEDAGILGQVLANDTDIANLQSTVNDPATGVSANASALNVLDTRITTAEDGITSNAADITALESTVNHPTEGVNANATAISSLDTRVTTSEGNISANSSDITALESTVNNPSTGVSANASGLAALDIRITANDADIAASASDISAIEAIINDPVSGNAASAAAISSLNVTVTQNGNDITSNASAITTLQSTVGTNTSSIQTLQTVQNGLTAEYSVRLDVNGYVTGFGLYNQGTSSTFLIHADKFAIGAPGSTGVIPFIVTTTTTTVNGQSVPPGVYMDQLYLRNGAIGSLQLGLAVIDDAHINSLSATKITTGLLNAARINIDGSTLISVGGVLQLGDVNANSITGGTLDFQNVIAENLTVADLQGDVSKFFPFSMASAANLGQGSTTIWAGQIPASETAGIGRAPYLIASGWGVFENDDAYRVSLHMRVNQAFSDYALGSVIIAGSQIFGDPPFNFFTYYYAQFLGNHIDDLRSGGTLSVSSVVKGTILSSEYGALSNTTTVWYTPTGGGLAVGNTVVADGGPASMDMVAHNFFRSSHDYHALNFSICGGLDVQATASVDVEIRVGLYNTAYKGIPSTVPGANWSGDQVFGLEGIMMGVR